MTDREQLEQLEAEFNLNGGRGIELADRIDKLRRKVYPDAPMTITLPVEAVNFYKAIQAAVEAALPDPTEVTESLIVTVDREITAINQQGVQTAPITDALDELWEHLREQGFVTPISDERLKEIRGE